MMTITLFLFLIGFFCIEIFFMYINYFKKYFIFHKYFNILFKNLDLTKLSSWVKIIIILIIFTLIGFIWKFIYVLFTRDLNLNNFLDKELDKVLENSVTEGISKYNDVNKSSYLPTDMDNILDNLNFESLSNYVLKFFRPVPVEGYLDDLIGQQLFIQFLLLSVVIGLILLFSVLIFIQIMINNKDFIIKRFNNRFILFYIKYQIILSKISLFIFPLLIMFGLIELFVGLHFIITHPIPYEKLPIDLHIYINKD